MRTGSSCRCHAQCGVFLVLPLIYEWIKDIERLLAGIYLLLAPGGLLAYMGYLWVRFGDPLLFYSAQESWGRQATGPLDTASRAWWRPSKERAGSSTLIFGPIPL